MKDIKIDIPENALVTAQVGIVLYLDEGGDEITVYSATTAEGHELPIVSLLGLLEITKSTALELTLRPNPEVDGET